MEFKLLVVGNAGVGKTAVTAWLAGLPGWNRLDHAQCCGGAGLFFVAGTGFFLVGSCSIKK